METALQSWELENEIRLVDPKRDALYNYDAEAQRAAAQARPWSQDPNYFKHVRISAVALIKMTMHARSGGNLEIMGLMQGYVDGDTFVVTDAFRLPVEGTETRVNVQDEANEYIVEYLDSCRAQGRQENVVGWYHSHPGYGCWLSGIDVDTQAMQQQFQDPFLAVVIDPHRTVSAGKVEIGAFRTYPNSQTFESGGGPGSGPPPAGFGSGSGAGFEAADEDGFQAVPLAKAAEFGAHASRYYSLEVSHFKSTLDTQLLQLLWHKYWVQTVSQNPLLTNRDYDSKQMLDLSCKVDEMTRNLVQNRGSQSIMPGQAVSWIDRAMDKLTNDVNLVANRGRTGLMAGELKTEIFNDLVVKKD
ncbi:COP9 signalosome catalytic subunit rri1 [Claviceps digitariae]|nr:COP9 signalosome catalytic subunit rri1 [Claviceps digitariae]